MAKSSKRPVPKSPAPTKSKRVSSSTPSSSVKPTNASKPTSTRKSAAAKTPLAAPPVSPGSALKSKPETLASEPELHKMIDGIDRELLRMLEQRCDAVRSLAELDRAGVVGRMTDASARTQSIVAKASSLQDRISTDAKQSLLRHVASICFATLHHSRIAFLGPLHSYSHLAAIKYFGEAALYAPVASIEAVFESVSRNDAIAGIVPIENSTDGRVVDTLSLFVRRHMHVCGEVLLPIHHCLLSRTPRDQIVEVYSKPQALSQCRAWLANHLPRATAVELSSTAAAARIAAEKHGAAAVASIEAGREYNLDVIDRNIEDNPNNVTRFAILGREEPAPTGDDKTSILFQVSHQPGALADAMAIFKKANLNLTWIESFPIQDKRNEYVFFVEFSGHRTEKHVVEALDALRKRAQRLDLLGSYPRAVL